MKTNYTRPALNRKAKRTTPYHLRKKHFNVHLNKELREKYGFRSIPVRKGDTVLILRGKYAGLQKKVSSLSLKKRKIQIENVKTTKTDGTEIFHYIEPSNVLLMGLGKIDTGRQKIIDRKTKSKSETESDSGDSD